MNEPPTCARCEDEYSLRDGMEPSKYCDPCAQERVSELEAMLATEPQRWRDVKVELPEPGKFVTIVIGGVVQYDAARWTRKDWIWWDEELDHASKEDVTHWQPLPIAPKERP